MLHHFLEWSKGDFFRDKSEAIEKAVRDYAVLKSQSSSETEIEASRDNAEELLTRIMKENGYADPDTAYISVDREFFTSEGLLDVQKLEGFQKEMIAYYGLRQIYWTFAGTSGRFTHITKRKMEEEGSSIDRLLPAEIREERRNMKSLNVSQRDPNTYYAYLYQDSTVSGDIMAEKLHIRHDVLSDTSGFNWSEGYSPDNTVEKKNWIAGFNEKGIWEKIPVSQTASFVDKSKHTTNAASLFGKTQEHGDIGIFKAGKNAYLFDSLSLLKDGERQVYYTVTGDVYGARYIDRENSLTGLKETLRGNNIDSLSGIVILDTGGDSVGYYRSVLKEFITPQTAFYTKTDPELMKRLDAMQNEITEKNITDSIVSGIFTLEKKTSGGEELFDDLLPSTTARTYTAALNIFDEKEDLLTFLGLAPVNEVLENSSAGYLNTIDIPPSKRKDFSNTVQNILFNYKTLFKHSHVAQIDVLRCAYDVIVKGNASALNGGEKIVTEISFHDLVSDGMSTDALTPIPSFRRVFRKNTDYYNLFDEQELNAWIDKECRPMTGDEACLNIKRTVMAQDIAPGLRPAFSRAVQNVFAHYRAIASSTGMKPEELIRGIAAVIAGRPEASNLKNKRVFLEATLSSVIAEASEGNPHRVRYEKYDMYGGGNVGIYWKPFDKDIDLFKEEDFSCFVSSPLIEESGLTKENIDEISDFLRNTAVSSEHRLQLSKAIINTIRAYPYRLKQAGIGLTGAFRIIESTIMNKEVHISPEMHYTVASAAGLWSGIPRAGVPFETPFDYDGLLKKDVATFVSSPVFVQNDIEKKEALQIRNILKKTKLSGEKRSLFSKAFPVALNTYGRNRAAIAGTTPSSFVRATAAMVEGSDSGISSALKPFIAEAVMQARFSRFLSTVSPFVKNRYLRLFKTLSLSVPAADLQALPANLFDREQYNRFVRSPMFARTGLDTGQLDTLLNAHKKAYGSSQSRFFLSIPIRYRSVPVEQFETFGIRKLQLPAFFHDETRETGRFAPIGWSNSTTGSGITRTTFAESLHRLAPPLKNFIFSSYNKIKQPRGHEPDHPSVKKSLASIPGESPISANTEPIVFPDAPAGSIETGITESDSAYSLPYKKLKQQITNQALTGPASNPPPAPPGTPYIADTNAKERRRPDRHPGDISQSGADNEKMKRIEEHYIYDKQMLTRSPSISPYTGSPEGGKQGVDEGNVIRKASDDIISEIMREIDEDLR
ncbi:MAG: hypothetical protein JW881_16775 [Spirochaetales bacterium]|nr:hypothetical protein [Spirochaetales bacterium]